MILGDDPRATLPDYVYTEKTPLNGQNSQHENETTNNRHPSATDETEHQMDVSNKTTTNTTETMETTVTEGSSVTTRNSLKKGKTTSKTSERSSTTTTRRHTKEKETINGHNEVSG